MSCIWRIPHSFEELSSFCDKFSYRRFVNKFLHLFLIQVHDKSNAGLKLTFVCSDCLFPIDAHFMQKGSSRQIKSSLGSRSCRVWCDLHHFSSTGRDNRHMDSPHTLPPIYVYTRILFHQYMFTRTLFHQYLYNCSQCTRILFHQYERTKQSTFPPTYAAKTPKSQLKLIVQPQQCLQ